MIRKRVVVALIVLGGPIVFLGVRTAMHEAREAMRRERSKENLRQLGIALDNYYQRHPPIDNNPSPAAKGNSEPEEAINDFIHKEESTPAVEFSGASD